MDINDIVDAEVIDSQPAETFKDFSYTMQDEPLDDLKKDLITLDQSVSNDLLVKYNGKASTSELAIRDIYKRFSESLGIKIGYTNFKDCVEHIAENNKVQRDILEAVNAKIAIDITQRAYAKLFITFNTLIDRATTMILKATERCEVEDFSPELIGMCDRCVQWMNQIDELRDKATSKISDPDKSIAKIIEKMQNQMGISGIKDMSSKPKHYSPQMVDDLLESISKGYNSR